MRGWREVHEASVERRQEKVRGLLEKERKWLVKCLQLWFELFYAFCNELELFNNLVLCIAKRIGWRFAIEQF